MYGKREIKSIRLFYFKIHANHNLSEKAVRIQKSYDYREEPANVMTARTGSWSVERYEYDSYGRLLSHEDARGNQRVYDYLHTIAQKLTPANMFPQLEISPDGYEFRYTYDIIGRKVRIQVGKRVSR